AMTDGKGCSRTWMKTGTVNGLPACSITGIDPACANSSGNTYTGPAGPNRGYSWSISGNGSISGSTTSQSVSVTAGAPGSFTLTLVVTDTTTGCTSTCMKMVTVVLCCAITCPPDQT